MRDDTRAALLQEIVQMMDCGIAAVDSDRGLILANDAARESLAPLVHLGDTGQPVVPTDASQEVHWAESLRKALITGFSVFAVGGGHISHVIALRRVNLGTVEAPDPVIVLISQRERPCSDLLISELSEMTGLTKAEQQIVSLLALGNSPGKIASMRNSAESTVRTQIKSILMKTRAPSTQSMLLQLAAMPPVDEHGRRVLVV